MHIRYVILLFAIIFSGFKNSYSQNFDTTLLSYDFNEDKTFYSALQNIINGNQPLTYFAVQPLFLSVERPIPLQQYEGRFGYLFEANMELNYPINISKSSDNYFLQTSRISFRYDPALRLTADDNLMLMPTNQKVGFEIDKILFENCSGNAIFSKQNHEIDYETLTKWRNSKTPIQMLYAEFTAMHYSNGLLFTGVYLDTTLKRNNYQNGFFTTNYVQLMFVYSSFNKKLLTAGIGYQEDFIPMIEMYNRYGQHRIIFLFQSRSKPRTAWFNLIPRLRAIKENDLESQKNYTLKRLWEHRLRLEGEYILGNLSDFNRSQEYRLGVHFYYEISPLRSKSVGFMFHAYYGRDYLNIRYDDIVFAIMGGFTLSLNKYHAPRFKTNDYILNSDSKLENINRK